MSAVLSPGESGAEGRWARLLAQAALPAAIGASVAALVLSDALWARGWSLRWAAPFLRGQAPPLLTIGLAALLAVFAVLATIGRRWAPRREHVSIVALFTSAQLVGFNLANLEPLKIVLLAVTAAWLVDALGNRRPIRLYPPHLLIWLVVLGFAFASVVNGLLGSLIAQYSIVAKFLMFFIVANIVRTPSQLIFGVRLLVWLGLGSALVALVQEGIYYFGGVALSLEDNAMKYWFKDTPLGWMIRATAFHPTAQNLSHFLLMALALLLFGPFTAAAKAAGACLLAAGVFFTFSGNGLVVMAFVLLAAPIVRYPRLLLHYTASLSLAGLMAWASGALEWVYQRYLLPVSGKSAEDRIGLLQAGMEAIERHPWLGVGLNNFGRTAPQPVHNAYLQLATEIGVIPGLLLCALLALIIVRLVIGIAGTRDRALRNAGKGALLAMLALGLHWLFEPFINSLVSWSIIGFAEAAALILCANGGGVPRPPAAAHGPRRGTEHG
jgi:O-antigen ligase